MKNFTIERLIAKTKQTERLDDAEYYLYQLSNLGVQVHYASDGQFTGGYYSEQYVYKDMVYEFECLNDVLLSGHMYPVEFL